MRKKKSKVKNQSIIMVEENEEEDFYNLKNQRKKKQPKTAQETIPFDEVYENGIFRVGNTYSLPFRINNIDYRMMRENEKGSVYSCYQKLLTSLSAEIGYQEFLMNTNYDFEELRKVLIPQKGKYEVIYNSYCEIIEDLVDRCRHNASERIFLGVISFTPQTRLDDISVLFRHFEEIQNHLTSIGSGATILKPLETFAIMHNFYHPLNDEEFLIPNNYYRNDVLLKDYIAPASFNFKSKENRNGKQLLMGMAYTRVLFTKVFSNQIDDEFIYDLLDNTYSISVSKHIRRFDKDEAFRILKTQMDDIEGRLERRREKNAKRGTAYIPFKDREKEEEVENLQTSLSSSDCDLHEFLGLITISASTLKELNELTAYVKNIGKRHSVNIAVLSEQQEQALNSALPLGINYLNTNLNNCCTNLLTPAVSNFIPFSHNNHFAKDGICYGINMQTNTPLVINRCDEMNANMFILATSGSGKSMFAKRELTSAMLAYPNDEFLFIDPDNEYLPLLKDFDGERIILAPDSKTYINIFDTDITFSEDGANYIALKSEFLMNFYEMAKGMKVTATEISIIDRCVKLVYKDFQLHDGDKDYLPTLVDFHNILLEQPEQEAKDIALNLELYVTGSFNNFSHHTNVEFNKKFIIFDIFQMGEQLRTVGLQVLLEIIWQRVITNKAKGVRTWLVCDEFSVMFSDGADRETEKSGKFFEKVFTRIRKYGGMASGLTQNITTVLQSKQATKMLNNSECVVLLQQKPTDLENVTKLFKLSPAQVKYISKGGIDGVGQGLFILGNKVIPFDNTFSDESYLYKLCSTKFSEKQRKNIKD